MRAVITRVLQADVKINGKQVAGISKGLLVLLGSQVGDSQEDIRYIVDKVCNLRIFEDEQGKMNLSVREIAGEILLVSQFTLLGDARKGRRPGFTQAGRPEEARELYDIAVLEFQQSGLPVQTGTFQADMQVGSVNDGPVTILLDSRRLF